MPDWTASMQQTFEFYIVDPDSWKDVRRIDNVLKCSIDWDSEAETLGSATLDVDTNISENYIRIYLVTIQNGVTEKHTLGTFLVQTPTESFDGLAPSISLDAYTPLLELKENYPDFGYFVPKSTDIMGWVSKLANENMRAPVIRENGNSTKLTMNYLADPNQTWLVFLKELALNANFEFNIDEEGRLYFSPKRDLDAQQAIWTFNDDNSSILYPEVSKSQDLFGIPNVVEVLCSTNDDANPVIHVVIENDDINSKTSIQNRGRRITHRELDPEIIGTATPERVREYATNLLKELSTVECTISYTHAYCPVRVGDCVRLNYQKAGLEGVKAKVVSQGIDCVPGCPVTETAVYTTKYWR
jgi:hypothetical protein